MTIARIVNLALGTVVLALILRTWLVLGLIEPVMVSGSSMAPALRGPHLAIICKRCGNQFDVGSEFQAGRIECLQCRFAANSGIDLPVTSGDTLIVDRTALEFRSPRRWEPVVFRSPDGGQLTVKRIVGLPGEAVELRDGDVWINGKVARKSLSAMRAMRQLVHEESNGALRWRSDSASQWQWHESEWQASAYHRNWQWLRYWHDNRQPIKVETAYNAGLSQRLFPARDLALSATIRAVGTGELAVQIHNGTEQFRWEERLNGQISLEAFTFDRCWRVFLDGDLVSEGEFAIDQPFAGTTSPFAIGARNLDVEITDLRLYRDIYYLSLNEEIGSNEPMAPALMLENEVYVLGDNVPVSIDSRHWGPIALRLTVGRPLGVR